MTTFLKGLISKCLFLGKNLPIRSHETQHVNIRKTLDHAIQCKEKILAINGIAPISIRYRIASDVPLIIGTDPQTLESVLSALIETAVEWSHTDTDIDMLITKQKGRLSIDFHIDVMTPRKVIRQILSLDPIIKHHIEINKSAVKCTKSNGMVSITLSWKYQPTRKFHVIRDHKPAFEPDSDHLLARTLNPCRILLVEDNIVLSDLLKTTLEKHGHHLTVAHNGDDALDLLVDLDHGFELVIADVDIPGITGIDVLKAFRFMDTSGTIPFIMISGDGSSRQQLLCKEAGASAFVPKPFRHIDLLRLIDTTVRAKQSQSIANQ